jgi:DNA-nicking Smr family endonuclease
MVRKLGSEEKALWGRVMATVKPLHPVKAVPVNAITKTVSPASVRIERSRDTLKSRLDEGRLDFARHERVLKDSASVLTSKSLPKLQSLDGTWDRQINKGAIIPDVSVDLHGSGLASAYARLDGALEQAIAQKLRVVLLVTGHQRAHDRASGEGRGAIASVVRDWLAASRHSSAIAAVRNAHPRHGGAGALYIVLKR